MAQTVFGGYRARLPITARWLVSLCSVAAGAVALGTPGALAQVPAVGATAEVRDTANRLVATAEFREGRGEVLITVTFPNPPVLAGTHAVHIHEVGRCDPPDFSSAGNIFNPYTKQHGRQNPQGAEVGDLPNVNFGSGLTSYNTSAPGATLGPGQGSLLGPNRTSLIVDSGEDDQATDPDGNSGMRIACGVITPVGATPPAPAVSAVPKVASPAPAQPAQPAAVQPAARPANSPVVARPPAVVNPAVSPVAVQAIPTPIVAPPTPQPQAAGPGQTGQTGNGGSGGLSTLMIAVLGVCLVAAGYLLRQRRQVR